MLRRIHGSNDHSDVIAALRGLAEVYQAQGRLDEAVTLYDESLAMERRTLGGKDHKSVVASLFLPGQVVRGPRSIGEIDGAVYGGVGDAAADPWQRGPQLSGGAAVSRGAGMHGSRSMGRIGSTA